MESNETKVTRRNFIGTVAVASSLLIACAKTASRKVYLPPLLDKAPDGPLLKAGLIGCGGRGTGAALNFVNAGPNLTVTAIGDVFPDRVESARKTLQEKANITLEDSNCFVGFDAFQKVIDSGVDLVILATPPHFRPQHFAAAIDAKKHVFMEKPVAVDPVGAKIMFEAGKKADAFGLSVVAGTQRRHQKEYVETLRRVADGAIGEIVAARCYWNQSQLWFREREAGWTDMEWMLRDWVNWTWLSGDHIVEQHLHNIDVINWFTGLHPVKAVGFGGRMRRVTGDQYDFFNVDFEMPNGVHVHSMCRQINGCVNNVSEFIVGTNGSTNCRNEIYKPDGSIAWKFEGEQKSAYDQEHVDLVTAIRTGQPVNETEGVTASTVVGIMGRISAYTGKEVTWDEVMASEMRLGPTEYQLGPMDLTAKIPVPGE